MDAKISAQQSHPVSEVSIMADDYLAQSAAQETKQAERAARIAAYKQTDQYRQAKQGARQEMNKIRPQLKQLKRVLRRA